MSRLQDKVAIVTGASRGIGRAIALRLAGDGANLVVTATSLERAESVATEIEALGRKALPLACDVAEFEQVESLIKGTTEIFSRIDILVNNAGITKDNLLIRMNQEQWDDVIAVNLKGTFNCIRAATKTLMKQRAGKIVNITSVVGIMGNAGQANYCASKAGVIGLTKSVARELAARNIQVNAVAPGFITTDMTAALPEEVKENLSEAIPLGRMGSPEEVAACVAYLASEDADYITGQVINVDGGMVM
ncbi:3-oxoacyl-[acyl-carrier-protein] reductase [candidate division KSB1 bacterium]|nr:3-oxoacyl-[acyl-carrier-protein] reductase [candidate division KSB1 bacterium]